jgi:hypothetical protein
VDFLRARGRYWASLMARTFGCDVLTCPLPDPVHRPSGSVYMQVDVRLVKPYSLPREPRAVECKWTSSDFDPASLQAFRRRYAKGENFVVASDVKQALTKRFGEIQVRFVSLTGLVERLRVKTAGTRSARASR